MIGKKYKSMRNKVNNMKKIRQGSIFIMASNCLLLIRIKMIKKYFWKMIRFFVKNSNTSTNIPPLKTYDNNSETIFFTDYEKANCLNNYFASISTINDNNISLPPCIPKTNNNLTSVSIHESEIVDIIKILSTNKACGKDDISHKMLKATVTSIPKPLSILFNRSLSEYQFHQSGKRLM